MFILKSKFTKLYEKYTANSTRLFDAYTKLSTLKSEIHSLKYRNNKLVLEIENLKDKRRK